MPVLYCCAAQPLHYQLGELRRNRGRAVNSRGSILPADLVRLERAAAAVSRLLAAWLSQSDGSLPPKIVFDGVRNEMMAAAFGTPPDEFRDSPDCRDCPTRCTMLPLAGSFARELVEKVASGVSANQTETGRAARIAEIASNARKAHPEAATAAVLAIDPSFEAWDYCAAANIALLQSENDLSPNESDSVWKTELMRILKLGSPVA
jgi:hypothetical protein